MRKIKFRGLSDEHVWVYGWFTDDDLSPDIIDGMSTRHKVLSKTVGQFTGLKDSTGKEIYEGDVLFVKAENPYWSKFDSKHVVTWCNDGWILNDYGTDDPGLFHILMNNNCEIIGNVHDNPELLEVGRQNERV